VIPIDGNSNQIRTPTSAVVDTNIRPVVPAALVGGLYNGLAGLVHVVRSGGNPMEQTANGHLVMFLVLATFVIWSLA
jgi:hypothetical protein